MAEDKSELAASPLSPASADGGAGRGFYVACGVLYIAAFCCSELSVYVAPWAGWEWLFAIPDAIGYALASLTAVCLVLGPGRFSDRLLAFGLTAALQNATPLLLLADGFLSAAAMLPNFSGAIGVAAGLLAAGGVRGAGLRLRRGPLAAAAAPAVRFSLGRLLLAVTAAAVVSSLLGYAFRSVNWARPSAGWDWQLFTFAVWFTSRTLTTTARLWAAWIASRPGRWSLTVMLLHLALTLVLNWLFGVPVDFLSWIAAGAIIDSLVFPGAMLWLRRAGWRLARSAA